MEGGGRKKRSRGIMWVITWKKKKRRERTGRDEVVGEREWRRKKKGERGGGEESDRSSRAAPSDLLPSPADSRLTSAARWVSERVREWVKKWWNEWVSECFAFVIYLCFLLSIPLCDQPHRCLIVCDLSDSWWADFKILHVLQGQIHYCSLTNQNVSGRRQTTALCVLKKVFVFFLF